ncbi:D-alanyl-D-alanine carboxypeptidase family protein [Bacillus sp. T33-2]|uniref:D-alanyl-D-alanine carboxypeptidase family protein n=1 Tax=Bacillus sp. T33-2 TaxID=2054168 RepID=UPI000C78EDF9|nr:D-alanyl-D-alanine carboxypeptidase family protein [Bacillus sp. T33-2]PLR99797.1 D-alanyl-D-alanine carboxypeptidase [Bacillus sp. T33-2]
MRQKWLIYLLLVSLLLINFPEAAAASVSVSAKSAVLMEQDSGRVLFEKDAHNVRRIASITKIMTAVLAIESGKMDEHTRVSEKAVRTEGSAIYLKPGEKIKLENLVYGLMLRSGNDSAVAIAEHVGGSLEGFVYLMNQKAKEIGMGNTHFANPHGLDDHENHYSTAYDMALLTRYAMKYEQYRKISGTKVHRAPNPGEAWDRKWTNKNRLLTELYQYCTGGKTGYTKRAKRTLVTTATKGDLDLIAVTLNGPDDWNDHIQMFEMGFRQYDMVEILPEGTIKSIDHPFYKKKVYLEHSFDYPLTKKEEDLVEVQFKLLHPKKQWKETVNVPDVVGKAVVLIDGRETSSMPIYYRHPEVKEKEKSFFDFFKHIFTAVLDVGGHG